MILPFFGDGNLSRFGISALYLLVQEKDNPVVMKRIMEAAMRGEDITHEKVKTLIKDVNAPLTGPSVDRSALPVAPGMPASPIVPKPARRGKPTKAHEYALEILRQVGGYGRRQRLCRGRLRP